MKAALGQKALGRIRHLSVTLFMGFKGFESMPWSWLSDLEHGGGALNALGSHYIDLIRYWCGDFESVSGSTTVWVPQRRDSEGLMKPVTADDAFALVGRLKSGAQVSVHLSTAAIVAPPPRIEILGSNGSMVLTGTDRIEMATDGDTELRPVEPRDPEWSEDTARCAVPRFGAIVEAWLDHAEGRSPRSGYPTFADGLAAQRIIDRLRESSIRESKEDSEA